jgi:hypothetical protein
VWLELDPRFFAKLKDHRFSPKTDQTPFERSCTLDPNQDPSALDQIRAAIQKAFPAACAARKSSSAGPA